MMIMKKTTVIKVIGAMMNRNYDGYLAFLQDDDNVDSTGSAIME